MNNFVTRPPAPRPPAPPPLRRVAPRLRSRALLRVIANPYNAFDHEGRLSSTVRYDPEHGRPGEIHHIDARLTTTIVEKRTVDTVQRGVLYRKPIPNTDPATAGSQRYVGGDADLRDHTVEHLLEGTGLPHSDYHVRMIKDGAILPLDEATHRIAFGVGPGKPAFKAPNEALAAARAALVEQWEAEHPDEPAPDWPEHTYDASEAPGQASGAAPPAPPAAEAPVGKPTLAAKALPVRPAAAPTPATTTPATSTPAGTPALLVASRKTEDAGAQDDPATTAQSAKEGA